MSTATPAAANGAGAGDASAADLQAAITAQASKVRELKADKSTPAEAVKTEVDALLALKKQLEALGISDTPSPSQPGGPGAGAGTGAGAAGGKGKGKSKESGGKLILKTPKGTRDWDPLSMSLRAHIFQTVTQVFEAHGAVTIDTPVFELRDILAGKYGEDGGKLIYDLQDQGGEICSLRYDLTVPFARFVAMNPAEYGSIKRYHIAKVYRRDQPVMTKGRFREFYQCDFDIAGVYDPMVPDAEILTILVEALEKLGMGGSSSSSSSSISSSTSSGGGFTIKLNHRKVLDGIFAVCGVPADKTRTISSAIDKLDKSPWDEVRREMVVEKGLDGAIADQIGKYVKLRGSDSKGAAEAGQELPSNLELLAQLQKDEKLCKHATAQEGLKDMELLFGFLEVFGVMHRMSFDLSLARGLDYYTGIIYEAITGASAPPAMTSAPAPAEEDAKKKDKQPKKQGGEEEEVDETKVGVGSIAAGGRYDHLVGMFSGSKKPDAVPCVGVSIGVERVFAIKMAQIRDQQARGEQIGVRAKKVEVFVMNMGEGLLKERMQVCKLLWENDIKAEFLYKNKPKVQASFAAVEKDQVPFAVMLAPEEWKAGIVRVKAQKGKDSEEGAGKGDEVKLSELVAYLKGRIADL